MMQRPCLYRQLFCVFYKQEIEAMDADDILARQVEQLDKEKRELQIRLKTQEKKVRWPSNSQTPNCCTKVVFKLWRLWFLEKSSWLLTK